MRKSSEAERLAVLVGRRIREFRQERSWTTRDLAALLQLPTEKLQAYEAGSRLPRVPTLVRLARVFGVSTAALVDDEGCEQPLSDSRLLALVRQLRAIDSDSDRRAVIDLLEALMDSVMLLFGASGDGDER
jgi:transcriptional regulator with XRE-family HTH domain